MKDPELVEAFLAESRENLATVEEDILALERSVGDPERVNHLFRALHAIKSSSNLLRFKELHPIFLALFPSSLRLFVSRRPMTT